MPFPLGGDMPIDDSAVIEPHGIAGNQPYSVNGRRVSVMLAAISRGARFIRNCVLLGAALAAAGKFWKGPRYTSDFSIVPQSASAGQLRGLAAQFGFDIGGSQAAESPFFYVELIQTDAVLVPVLARKYTVKGSSGDYAAIVGITAADSGIRMDKALRKFRRNLSVSADRRTNIVSVSVTEKDPQLALQLARALLEQIAIYNRDSRQSRAAAERRFVEARLASARAELTSAEDSLQRFLTQNREFRASPELSFEYERLDRSVQQHSGVVTSLAQNFEQARLDEVRDTPVFSVVQPPLLPPRPDSRGWLTGIVVGLLLGLMFGLLIQIGRGVLAEVRRSNPQEFATWVGSLRSAARNLIRW